MIEFLRLDSKYEIEWSKMPLEMPNMTGHAPIKMISVPVIHINNVIQRPADPNSYSLWIQIIEKHFEQMYKLKMSKLWVMVS